MSQSCAGLLKAAVRQSPAFSRQGVLERRGLTPIEETFPAPLRRRFHYHDETSRRLSPGDRSCLYGAFHLYELTE